MYFILHYLSIVVTKYCFSLHKSNEVGGSYHMEKEGLVRAVKSLREEKFRIDLLVTDRHYQIAKWVRENLLDTDHRYDIWHMAKCKHLLY